MPEHLNPARARSRAWQRLSPFCGQCAQAVILKKLGIFIPSFYALFYIVGVIYIAGFRLPWRHLARLPFFLQWDDFRPAFRRHGMGDRALPLGARHARGAETRGSHQADQNSKQLHFIDLPMPEASAAAARRSHSQPPACVRLLAAAWLCFVTTYTLAAGLIFGIVKSTRKAPPPAAPPPPPAALQGCAVVCPRATPACTHPLKPPPPAAPPVGVGLCCHDQHSALGHLLSGCAATTAARARRGRLCGTRLNACAPPPTARPQ